MRTSGSKGVDRDSHSSKPSWLALNLPSLGLSDAVMEEGALQPPSCSETSPPEVRAVRASCYSPSGSLFHVVVNAGPQRSILDHGLLWPTQPPERSREPPLALEGDCPGSCHFSPAPSLNNLLQPASSKCFQNLYNTNLRQKPASAGSCLHQNSIVPSLLQSVVTVA